MKSAVLNPQLHGRKRGFSLIEIIVFVTILSVAMVSLVGSVTYSSLLLANAQHKVVATRYSEEVAEWLKFQREYVGFAEVLDQIQPASSVVYCFNQENVAWPAVTGGCASSYLLDNFYQRTVTLTYETVPAELIKAEVTTSWRTLGDTKSVTIHSQFSNYD